MFEVSPLQKLRSQYSPKIPKALRCGWKVIKGANTQAERDGGQIKEMFPHTYGLPMIHLEEGEMVNALKDGINIGVILSGGPAPGGHNVITGLFDGIKQLHESSKLFGFLMGPDGLVNHNYIEITKEIVDKHRNTGGFDMIGSGRTKLEKPEQFDRGIEILHKLNIRAVVIIGGDDSNTNACMMAEYFLQKGENIQVIGCPKTIDGDLKNEDIECSFGFDTATKVYSELIGNIQRDCLSSKKNWHFIKLMGRTASHITLECALKCQPNITLISENIQAKDWRINDVVNYMANIIAQRAAEGKMYGTALIPEGILEFLPSFRVLIDEINEYLSSPQGSHLEMVMKREKVRFMSIQLSEDSSKLLQSLPYEVALQLLEDRDPHGNVMVSKVDTEKLFVGLVAKRLEEMRIEGTFSGKFSTQTHFLGYEGRCAFPSNYDADYCYSLGRTAVALIADGLTGYMATVRNTTHPADECIAGGVPLTKMMYMERRGGQLVPVIKKSLVNVDGKAFEYFERHREKWALEDCYNYPGPIAFYGPRQICDEPTLTIRLELDSTTSFE
ncbi:diphosphate--fructose-6-phosphate 1-phosphotransferase [Falsiporphyromonas endometrii]|uniref:Pyrophosphate--fructose 6-phosphate 1-phosphotransferase n=1 Tax=Falsiporphyromonas endometrii TaxID=1387297 RepID=A0ABV9K6C3_9PORP